jgi:hypothetical protein
MLVLYPGVYQTKRTGVTEGGCTKRAKTMKMSVNAIVLFIAMVMLNLIYASEAYAYITTQVLDRIVLREETDNIIDFDFDEENFSWFSPQDPPHAYLITTIGTTGDADVALGDAELLLKMEDTDIAKGMPTIEIKASDTLAGTSDGIFAIYMKRPISTPPAPGVAFEGDDRISLILSGASEVNYAELYVHDTGEGSLKIEFIVDGQQGAAVFPYGDWDTNDILGLRIRIEDAGEQYPNDKNILGYYSLTSEPPSPYSDTGWTLIEDFGSGGWQLEESFTALTVIQMNPEPATMLMFLSGLAGLGYKIRRRFKR